MKIDRVKILAKYGGRCAYCGCKIGIKDMQIDHIKPKRSGGTDDMENLNPACRLCNHYKRANTLEEFRSWQLGGLVDRLRKIYIFRVAERYGMVNVKEFSKTFYFERYKKGGEK